MGRRNYRDQNRGKHQHPPHKQTMPFEEYDGMAIIGPSQLVGSSFDRQAWGPKQAHRWRIPRPAKREGGPQRSFALNLDPFRELQHLLAQMTVPDRRRFDLAWLGENLESLNRYDTLLEPAIDSIAEALEATGLTVAFVGCSVFAADSSCPVYSGETTTEPREGDT